MAHSQALSPEDRALARAGKAAFDLIMRAGLLPSPENYTLLYRYAAGKGEAYRERLESVLARHGTDGPGQTQRELTGLYEQYAGSSGLAAETGARLDEMVESMAGVISDADSNARDYGMALTRGISALGAIGGGEADENIRDFVSRMVSETEAAVSRNHLLEQRLQEASSQIVELRSELGEAQARAATDPLTGLCNRSGFEEAFRRASALCAGKGLPFSALMCDVDHFKSFNDTHGHSTGDQVLMLVAGIVRDGLPPNADAGRLGGEEFAALMPDVSLKKALAIADNMRRQLSGSVVRKRNSGEVIGQVTMSMGVAAWHEGETLGMFLARADLALYEAKAAGRNRVVNAETLDSRERTG